MAVAAGAALVFTLTSCSGSSEVGGPFVYNVGAALPTVVMSPYSVVPEVNGYWKDAGVDVQVEHADGSTAALQLLLSGRADIVQSGVDAAYSTAARNPSLRVVSLTPKNIWRLAVPESTAIDSIDDLRGQKIGVVSLTSGSYTYGRSIVRAAGLDPDSDVEWLPIGTGTQAAEALDSGRVSAYSSYDGPLDIVGTLTQDALRPLPSELDEVPGSLAYVTTDDVLEKRRDEVVAFLKGTYEGMVFSLANPEASIQIYWNRFNDQKPTDTERAAVLAQSKQIVANGWANRFAVGDSGMRGFLTPDRVQAAADYFQQYQITEGSVDVDKIVDLEINTEANDFDTAAIEREAANWTP
ncbi:hypothetical protein DBV08_17880 [Rhodococcus sp. KBW08]|uniref:ABC transporter substrate-binding protein n=1 Tax=Rhodococcus sp. KBW08 TaxID=2144188 RepID=UPI000F5AE220|nr:ABC transporter substrate-binding protein [Rhodococcus sp. KBW08]RQO46027.1 hypothetical protein DBV08_17880 [Rhodococcus sp. KBW08]